MKKNKYFKLSKKQYIFIFSLAIASFVYITSYIANFALRFVSNCIIEWPIRWDVKTCWNQQKGPAEEKALEKASYFVP